MIALSHWESNASQSKPCSSMIFEQNSDFPLLLSVWPSFDDPSMLLDLPVDSGRPLASRQSEQIELLTPALLLKLAI